MAEAMASMASPPAEGHIEFKCPICGLCMSEKKDDVESILFKTSKIICSRCKDHLGPDFLESVKKYLNGLVNIFEENETKEITREKTCKKEKEFGLFLKKKEKEISRSLFCFLDEFREAEKALMNSFHDRLIIAECENKKSDCGEPLLSLGRKASLQEAIKKMKGRRCKCGGRYMVYIRKPSPHRY